MAIPRILIVEDDAILAAHLREMLPHLGYEVAGLAATGSSAIENTRCTKPDAILMDIRLRGTMTGIEAAEEIRKSSDVPVVYLTAYTDELFLEKAKATDAYAFLAKPVRERELRASLEMALYKHASEKKMNRLNLVLRAVRDINQLIARERDPKCLLEEACEILVSTRGYSIVWIGDPNLDWTRIIRTAGAGSEKDFTDDLAIVVDGSPSARALLTRRQVVYRVLADAPEYERWCAQAAARGLVSAAAIPMFSSGRLLGVMCLYANDTSIFDDEEVSLLQEVANDLAFGRRSLDDERARMLSEKALAREKERLAVTLRCIGDGVIATDTSCRIVTMNKAAERLTGWAELDAAGKPSESVFVIINERSRIRYPDPVLKAIESRAIVGLDNRAILVSRDGKEHAIADSCSPILDDNGSIAGAVIVFSDITEKRKLIDAAQRSQKLESLGVLAGGIAHDFNNLLSGIYGNMEMARMKSGDPRVNAFLDAMLSTLERARALTGQLLTFAKGGAPDKRTDRLFPLVSQSVEFALSGSNVACDTDIPDDLWLCDFDSNQIAQVFDNITLNAVQAMPLGGTIRVSAENMMIPDKSHPLLPAGNYIAIAVSDKGVGIPSEILSCIFDPFFTTKQKGNGLGLAIAYSTLNKHGGTIDVESEPGKGSTFTVLLPASKRQVIAGSKTGNPIVTGSGRILIMDDDTALRMTYSVMLENLGYTVVCAKEGGEAVRIFLEETAAERPFNAIVLDLTVQGGLGGKETACEIRKIDLRIPMIVASGYSEDEVLACPAKFGFDGSLRKPFTLSELSRCLASLARPAGQKPTETG